jgi:hypothetical protein
MSKQVLQKANRLAAAYSGPVNLHGEKETRETKRLVSVFHFPSWSFIQAANEASGFHWFKPETRRFFCSSIHRYFGSGVFVTSEKAGFNNPSRVFSVRLADESGHIYTWNKFGHFSEHRSASAAARNLAALLGDGFTVTDGEGQTFTLDLPSKLEAIRKDLKKWRGLYEQTCREQMEAREDSEAENLESSRRHYFNGVERIEQQLSEVQAVFNRKASRIS